LAPWDCGEPRQLRRRLGHSTVPGRQNMGDYRVKVSRTLSVGRGKEVGVLGGGSSRGVNGAVSEGGTKWAPWEGNVWAEKGNVKGIVSIIPTPDQFETKVLEGEK